MFTHLPHRERAITSTTSTHTTTTTSAWQQLLWMKELSQPLSFKCLRMVSTNNLTAFTCITLCCHDLPWHAVPTSAPQNVNVTTIGSSVVRVTWEPPVFDTQNGLIRFYVLRITEIETETQLSITVTDTLQTNVSDLHPVYNYELQVAATTVDTGPFSEPITWQLPEGCECAVIVFYEFDYFTMCFCLCFSS